MRDQMSAVLTLRSRVSAQLSVWRDRRHLERYLDDSSPSARRELEVILVRSNFGRDL
jgi:hypothetical protein